MMKNKAYDLTVYSFRRNEILLLDTNVWLYLYPPPSNPLYPYAMQYSRGVKSMLLVGAQPIIDALVLSEYLNRYCRIEWVAVHRSMYRDFKAFRQSHDFIKVGSGAATFARSILKRAVPCDHPFSKFNVSHILTDFESGSSDFNDGLLAENCRHNGWKLVTNDSDFTSGGIEVLTTNPSLLMACP